MSVIDDWATWKTKITSPLTHYLHLKNVCWVGNTPHYDKIHWFQASPSYLCNSSLDLEHVFFCYLPVSTQILPDASIWRQLFYQKLDFAPDVQLGSFGDSCLSLSPLGPREVYRWEDQLQLLLSSILLGDKLAAQRSKLRTGECRGKYGCSQLCSWLVVYDPTPATQSNTKFRRCEDAPKRHWYSSFSACFKLRFRCKGSSESQSPASRLKAYTLFLI